MATAGSESLLECALKPAKKQPLVAESIESKTSADDSPIGMQVSIEPDASIMPSSRLLRSGISRVNFWSFLFAAMMVIAGLVFLNADQTYVMVDILNYPRSRVGNAAGTLAFADELLSMLMVSIWGATSDRIGRRPVFATGLAIMAAATALYPLAGTVFPEAITEIFQSLLGFRLLFAVGASAATAMLTALIGDYAREGSRSKMAGVTGFATGVGALFAALVLSRLPTFFTHNSAASVPGGLRDLPNGGVSLVLSFGITGALLLLAAITSAFGLKGGTAAESKSEDMPLIRRIQVGLAAVRQPMVALAYASGFVARADSIALTLFIAPWVDNYMTARGLCPPRDPEVLTRCQPAKRLASTLMSMSHLTMLLGAPIFGILSDRIGAHRAILIPAISGLVAFGILFQLSDPSQPIVYAAMALAGLADIGMIISSVALMATVSAPHHRGALAGVYSLFGALGIITASKLGGYLFDVWKETASFLVVAIASGVVLVGGLVLLSSPPLMSNRQSP